jgi:RecA-family ATPase
MGDIRDFEPPTLPHEKTKSRDNPVLWGELNLAATLRAPRTPKDFIIPGFKAGTLGALVAPGGTGKSFLALELAMAVASPLADVAGFNPPGHGKVLYVNGEDPEDEMADRVSWISERFPPQADPQLLENLRIVPAMGSLLDFGRRPQGDTDRISQDLGDLILNAHGCRLIVIDTLTRFHTMNENDNGQMGQVLANFEHVIAATGAALLFIHHTNKSSTREGDTDNQAAARGADTLMAHSRFAAYLAKMTEAEAEKYGADPERRGHYLRFGASKQNYGQSLTERWFERKEGGVLLPVELTPQNPQSKAERRMHEKREVD